MCTDDGMEISEYCDYRLVNKIALQKESVGYRILQMVNDKILSIGDIASFMTNVTQETIKAKIDDLYELGLFIIMQIIQRYFRLSTLNERIIRYRG